jgi:hypothetical protein
MKVNPSHPPALANIGLSHSVRMRFIAQSAQDYSVTFQNLLDIWLFTTGAASAYQIFNRVKVRRVSVWAIPILGQATTAEVIFGGASIGATGAPKTCTDTSMGVQPAHVAVKPDARSTAAQYQPSVADVAFTVNCPAGSVVDVEATYLQEYGVSTASQNVPAGATAGFIANRGLDGLAKAGTQFLPVTDVVV